MMWQSNEALERRQRMARKLVLPLIALAMMTTMMLSERAASSAPPAPVPSPSARASASERATDGSRSSR
jgi:hypothetical protein